MVTIKAPTFYWIIMIENQLTFCIKQHPFLSKWYSDIFPTRCNITQFIYFWKAALRVLGGISTHHQEHTQLYLQYPVLVKPFLLPAAIVEELELQHFHDSGR